MGTRLLFGLVGQATEYTLGKVTFTGNDAAADHASLVTIAAEALGVPTPTNLGAVRIFLARLRRADRNRGTLERLP